MKVLSVMNRGLKRQVIVLYIILHWIVFWGCGCAGIRSYPRYPFRADHRCGGRIGQNRERIENVITSYLGTPYRWGGENQEGLDCSGLVVGVFQKALGVDLPHSTEKLFQMGQRVKRNRLCFGDFVFFSDTGSEVTHVGIYLGRNQFVHASKEKGVTISKLESSYFQQRYIGARRIIL